MDDFFGHIQTLTGITKYSSSEVITPIKVVNDMVNLLPAEVFNSKTRFLDPAVKSGRFLVEIYNRLMKSPEITKDFPNESERSRYILHNQLYGFATSPVAATITRKQLYGDAAIQGNIVYESGYISKIKNNPSIIKEITKENFGDTMKFDVVIGNPPYQYNSSSIYHQFIDGALEIYNSYICMITKNNWLTSDTLKDTRNRMIDAGITDIINYPLAYEVFDGASPSVSIFKIGKTGCNTTKYREIRGGDLVSSYEQNLKGMPVILGDRLEQSIMLKIRVHIAEDNFGSRTYPDECFRINSNGTVGRGENTYKLQSTDHRTEDNNIAVVYMNSSKKPYCEYISYEQIPSRAEIAEDYKIVCGGKLLKDDSVIRNIALLKPNSVCSKSWGLLYTCKTREEAVKVAKYIKSRLFRFLLRAMLGDGMNALSSYRFSLIPLPDTSENSDIDWSQSIDNIDEQLFNKYNLSEEEIAYIKQTIKPIE